MELTGYLLWIGCTWLVGNLAMGFVNEIKKNDTEMRNKIRDHLNHVIHRVEEETQGEIKYWFDHDDGEFLGQGRSTTELIEHVQRRFPGHIFIFKDQQYLAGPDWQIRPAQPGFVMSRLPLDKIIK